MGDNRYYTFNQFLDVFFIMVLVIFSVFSIVRIYYRSHEYAKTSIFFLPLSTISLFGLIRIVEYVYPNIAVCSMLRSLSLTFILIAIFTINMTSIRLRSMFIIAGFLVILPIFNLVRVYEFHELLYSQSYKLLYFLVFLKSVYTASKHFHIKDKRLLAVPNILLFLLPSLTYLIMLVFNSRGLDYIEILMMMTYTIYINLKFFRNDKSSYAVLAFEKIGNMGHNYIFVLDENKRIIYRNQAVKSSSFFSKTSTIDVSDFSQVFQGQGVNKYKYKHKEYLELILNEEKVYFEYLMTELKENDQLIGYILTFMNITELLNLLMSLEEKKKESERIHHKLTNYSEVVYHLEKEKEINKLLEEIITSREKQMTYLSQMVNDANVKLDDHMFEKYIEVAINKSNEVLEEVRDTVSQYRAYYGG